jgi:hypothetical protein
MRTSFEILATFAGLDRRSSISAAEIPRRSNPGGRPAGFRYRKIVAAS